MANKNIQTDLTIDGKLTINTIDTSTATDLLVDDGNVVKKIAYADLVSGEKPSAPTGVSAVEYSDRIEVSFNQVTGATRYEVWSSVADETNYDLIAVVNENQITATMTVRDTSYGVSSGTVYYRVYAFNESGQSAAGTDNVTLAAQETLEVTNLQAVAEENFININYQLPDDLRFSYVEVYVGSDPTSTVAKPASPVYTGTRDNYTYSIPTGQEDYYFQVWVDTIMN